MHTTWATDSWSGRLGWLHMETVPYLSLLMPSHLLREACMIFCSLELSVWRKRDGEGEYPVDYVIGYILALDGQFGGIRHHILLDEPGINPVALLLDPLANTLYVGTPPSLYSYFQAPLVSFVLYLTRTISYMGGTSKLQGWQHDPNMEIKSARNGTPIMSLNLNWRRMFTYPILSFYISNCLSYVSSLYFHAGINNHHWNERKCCSFGQGVG